MKFYFFLLQCHHRPREPLETGALLKVVQDSLLQSDVTSIELSAFLITEEESMF